MTFEVGNAMIHLRKKIETSLAMFAKKVIQFGRIVAVCSSLLILSGCGQTGPLYLPDEPAKTTPTNEPENQPERASASSPAAAGEVAGT